MLNRTVAPAAYEIQGMWLVEPQSYIWNNGLCVFTFHAPDQPLVKAEFVFKNVFDSQKEDPLQNMALSAMMREGTSKMSSAEIAEAVDYYGAYLVPEFSFDYTSFTLYTLSKYVDQVLPILHEIFIDAQLPESELLTYKRTNKHSLQISLEKNEFIAKRAFYQQLFGENRYGRVTIESSLDALNREELHRLMFSQMRPENCTLFLSGNVSEELLQQTNNYFGERWSSLKNIESKPSETSFRPMSAYSTDLIYQERVHSLQSAIRLGSWGLQRTNPEFPALQFVNTLFGGYFGSRLMRNIREDKGYTYGISSSVVSFQHVGMIAIATQVGAEVTQSALDEIKKEMDVLQDKLADDGEVSLVKNYLLGAMLGSLESIFSHADKFKAVYYAGLDLDYYPYYAQVIHEMDAIKVRDIAGKYLQYDAMAKVIVGKM
ncbi:M16 family metallopeptidase [Sphingobacterium corticis]|uniref:M16 family metallopeptidase n=1 Tax=Sphingobacterium corticis TaxID=1812823 RepID=A0ABW5NL09_9SPHI